MNTKSMIVYYSWVGNTHVVATEIQRLTGFEVQRIEEKKHRKFGNIAGGAMGAFLGLKSRIMPMDYALTSVENIFLGVQVWAGKTPPAVNKYLSKVSLKNKKIWLFITKSDEKIPQEYIDSITKRIERKGGIVVDSISITTKWDPATNIPITVTEFEEQLRDWLKNCGVM
jgi:flavodoxin